MPLKLQQSRAINELATALYSFLPGAANSTVSFEGVAETAGVARHWKGGSKRPAIADLLADTLERNPTRFCNLIVEIVRGGLKYRAHDPISREEMDHVNRIVADIGFKIPELNEQRFLRSLVSTSASETSSISAEALLGIEKKLRELTQLAPVKRGFAFEHLLNEMFALSGLAPRGAFRLIGEQIDGSFQLGDTTYLLEAKWQNAPLGQEELLVLSGKVGGKAEWSRGLLVSISGFSEDGLAAFQRGKRTNIVCFDGFDLSELLRRNLNLRVVIERKSRRAAETNDPFVSIRELFPGP